MKGESCTEVLKGAFPGMVWVARMFLEDGDMEAEEYGGRTAVTWTGAIVVGVEV